VQPPGVKHLGFNIPLTVTQLLGRRANRPGKGSCFRCLRARERVYVLGDGRCLCDDCTVLDLVEHGHGLGGQPRPAEFPVEVIYENAATKDKFDIAFWERALS